MRFLNAKKECQALANQTGERYSLVDGYDERDRYTFVPVPTASLNEFDTAFFTATPEGRAA